MFDFHLHSNVSFDSDCPAEKIVKRAEEIGLKEICFTDHYDYFPDRGLAPIIFDLEQYNRAYGNVSSETVKVRTGVEFGLSGWNSLKLTELLQMQEFDFVIGSVHYIESGNPYKAAFWQEKSVAEALELYFNDMYGYVKRHGDFDVLGHMTYISKCPNNPERAPIPYRGYADIIDEIFKDLIQKGIGLEVNTSGVDFCGTFLPDREYLMRFKDLGGEIVTVGSDAHDENRVGQHSMEALEMIKDIFGYVCTFEKRKPIFHKL